MNDISTTPTAARTTPNSSTRPGPLRSISTPTNGAATPPTSERSEKASEVAATLQPNSSTTSVKIVPNP